jgi:hypothetical protein
VVFDGVYVGILTLPDAIRTSFFEGTAAALVAGSFDLSSLVLKLIAAASNVMKLGTAFIVWAAIAIIAGLLVIIYGLNDGASDCVTQAWEWMGCVRAWGGSSPTEATPLKKDLLGSTKSIIVNKQAAASTVDVEGQRVDSVPLSKDSSRTCSGCCGRPATAGEGEAEGGAAAQGGWLECLRAYWAPLARNLFTVHNLLLVGFMTTLNLTSAHFLTSHVNYLGLMLGFESEKTLGSAFDVMFPVLGFLSALPCSALLSSRTQVIPWVLLSCTATLWMILTMISSPGTQWIAAALFGPMRMLQWAAYYRLVGSCPDLYEPEVVGRVLGYDGIIIALFGDGLGPVMLLYAMPDENHLKGAHLPREERLSRYLTLKVILFCFFLPVAIGLPWYLRRRVLQKASSST